LAKKYHFVTILVPYDQFLVSFILRIETRWLTECSFCQILVNNEWVKRIVYKPEFDKEKSFGALHLPLFLNIILLQRLQDSVPLKH